MRKRYRKYKSVKNTKYRFKMPRWDHLSDDSPHGSSCAGVSYCRKTIIWLFYDADTRRPDMPPLNDRGAVGIPARGVPSVLVISVSESSILMVYPPIGTLAETVQRFRRRLRWGRAPLVPVLIARVACDPHGC